MWACRPCRQRGRLRGSITLTCRTHIGIRPGAGCSLVPNAIMRLIYGAFAAAMACGCWHSSTAEPLAACPPPGSDWPACLAFPPWSHGCCLHFPSGNSLCTGCTNLQRPTWTLLLSLPAMHAVAVQLHLSQACSCCLLRRPALSPLGRPPLRSARGPGAPPCWAARGGGQAHHVAAPAGRGVHAWCGGGAWGRAGFVRMAGKPGSPPAGLHSPCPCSGEQLTL